MLFAKRSGDMKKIICIAALLMSLVIMGKKGFAADTWYEGKITGKAGTSLTVNGRMYTFDANTIIKDEHDITAPAHILGIKTCCDNIRFLLREGSVYIEKIIIETDKAVW
jgi:hypothetical protein